MTDREVERLLAGLEIKTFASRDEQEVAGYAGAMETIFYAWQDIPINENHIKQLHRDLLRYSEKDERHRGEYKKMSKLGVAVPLATCSGRKSWKTKDGYCLPTTQEGKPDGVRIE